MNTPDGWRAVIPLSRLVHFGHSCVQHEDVCVSGGKAFPPSLSLPSVSLLPLSGSLVGVPGPMGQDSELLQSGLVVAQPGWEQSGSSLSPSLYHKLLSFP